MMDFQAWKEKVEDTENPWVHREKVMYKLYEKSVFNPKVM